jgi:uncharacterized protein (DUF2235 family)
MSKFIVFCADGTWNGPGQDDNGDREPDVTNVYKLFLGLAGELSVGTIRDADEQEKVLTEAGKVSQVAKYIHGVGDSRNPIRKIFGGAFGSGMIARIVRGYTFISRNYEPGDAIVITGFSRGAYTARALAGLIVSQGVLAKPLTTDKTDAYRRGAQAWYRYRKRATESRPGIFQRLAEAAADLPAFLSHGNLKDTDLVPVDKIKAVAVWDTVGALGLPLYIDDRRADAFKFADTILSPKVEKGFHAVALDEQRVDFTPTLWDKADNVVQMLFPGAHSDVGGGYTTKDNESGLSDIALEWMAAQLHDVGVRFAKPIYKPFLPDVKGIAHRPWLEPPFNKARAVARQFKDIGILEHPSIATRMNAGAFIHFLGEAPILYAPSNRP